LYWNRCSQCWRPVAGDILELTLDGTTYRYHIFDVYTNYVLITGLFEIDFLNVEWKIINHNQPNICLKPVMAQDADGTYTASYEQYEDFSVNPWRYFEYEQNILISDSRVLLGYAIYRNAGESGFKPSYTAKSRCLENGKYIWMVSVCYVQGQGGTGHNWQDGNLAYLNHLHISLTSILGQYGTVSGITFFCAGHGLTIYNPMCQPVDETFMVPALMGSVRVNGTDTYLDVGRQSDHDQGTDVLFRTPEGVSVLSASDNYWGFILDLEF
jgi:hypothetical protein